jgi:hypothetical protein
VDSLALEAQSAPLTQVDMEAVKDLLGLAMPEQAVNFD